MLSPCHPEIGTKATAAGLYPTFLMNPLTSFWISSKRSLLYGGSVESILLTPTMSCLTPRVYASILEGTLSHFLGFLLELFDGTFVNTTTFIDQMTSSGRLARVYVTNHDNVDMSFFLTHFALRIERMKYSERYRRTS